MSEVKKEIASAFKWILVIIVAAITYKSVYIPHTSGHYRFISTKNNFMRANTVTGKVEYIKNCEWEPVNEVSDAPDFYALVEEYELNNAKRNISRK